MRRLNGIAAAFALLLTAPVFAQATDHTVLVDWNPLQSTAICSFFEGTRNVSFTDTAGSNWSYLKVRIPLAVTQTQSGPPMPVPPAIVSIAINGVPVGNPVVVPNVSFACGPYVTYEFGVQSLPGYRPFQRNTFTITSAGSSAGNSGEKAELIFRIEPRSFAFDLVPAMAQKVILHPKFGDGGLSPWQVVSNVPGEKPRFRFRGAVSSSTAGLEADVWLRVVDPPDTAPYVPQAQRVPDDNQDPLKKGVLMPRGCTTPSCA